MDKSIPNNFQPEYTDSKWIIRHGITGSITIRERSVNQSDWMNT